MDLLIVFVTALREEFVLGMMSIGAQGYLADMQFVHGDSIVVEMLSPIVAYVTEKGQLYTRYYGPRDVEFYRLITDNAHRKYVSYYGREPYTNLEIELIVAKDRNKLVTRYKGRTIVEAWGGRYRINGDSDTLSLIYNAGLGSKNSQGFGMMKLIE